MEERECKSTSCDGKCSSCKKKSFLIDQNEYSDIKHIVAVSSGKGGVGKSFTTASIANILAKNGYKVGILDADITGPSIPKMYGLTELEEGSEKGMHPSVAANGVKVMSVNLILDSEDSPVIWRGPVIANVVKQFYNEVIWGELDYLLIDMPPGTGDVPLTVFQSLPVDGTVIISSPQDLVKMIVKKAYGMAVKMDIDVLGIIENYSYIECQECKNRIEVFGESKVDEIARELSIDALAKLPIDRSAASLADKGEFAEYICRELEEAVEKITNKCSKKTCK